MPTRRRGKKVKKRSDGRLLPNRTRTVVVTERLRKRGEKILKELKCAPSTTNKAPLREEKRCLTRHPAIGVNRGKGRGGGTGIPEKRKVGLLAVGARGSIPISIWGV